MNLPNASTFWHRNSNNDCNDSKNNNNDDDDDDNFLQKMNICARKQGVYHELEKIRPWKNKF